MSVLISFIILVFIIFFIVFYKIGKRNEGLDDFQGSDIWFTKYFLPFFLGAVFNIIFCMFFLNANIVGTSNKLEYKLVALKDGKSINVESGGFLGSYVNAYREHVYGFYFMETDRTFKYSELESYHCSILEKDTDNPRIEIVCNVMQRNFLGFDVGNTYLKKKSYLIIIPKRSIIKNYRLDLE